MYILTELLYFASNFDTLRMMKASLQNDFSIYRRLLNKMSHPDIVVDKDKANTMAYFIGDYMPMINTICKSAKKVNDQDHSSSLSIIIAIYINSLYKYMITHNKPSDLTLKCATVITSACIIYDYLTQKLFHQRTIVNIIDIIKTFKKYNNQEEYKNLLSQIQYKTKTMKQAPPNIQKLFL